MQTIKIVIPKGFMNVAVTKTNHLIADTNNECGWDRISIELPILVDGIWRINSIKNNTVMVHPCYS